MTLSISRLYSDGTVGVSVSRDAIGDITAGIGDYPAEFRAAVRLCNQYLNDVSEYRVSAALGSLMTAEGQLGAYPLHYTFGYPHAYVGDGFLLCPNCVKTQVIANGDTPAPFTPVDPEQMRCELFVYGETPQDGDTCDHCGDYIPGAEPYCGDCAGDGTASELIHSETGDRVLCRDCIARRLIETRNETRNPHDYPAFVISPGAYQVNGARYITGRAYLNAVLNAGLRAA